MAVGFTDVGDALCEDCMFEWSMHEDELDLEPDMGEMMDGEEEHQIDDGFDGGITSR